MRWTAVLLGSVLFTLALRAENAAKPDGEPVLETPTLHCLGAYWIIKGDDNANARVEIEYRAQGGAEWKRGPNLFRTDQGEFKDQHGGKRKPAIAVPSGARLFAGSVFLLQPDTAYELKLKLIDPDGGNAEKTLSARTIAEPTAPKDLKEFHVTPGDGGGDGSAANPFKGLKAAQEKAAPGTLFLLHAGTYAIPDCFTVRKSGEPGKPIVFRAAGDGDAILDGKRPKEKMEGTVVDVSEQHDIFFENLWIKGAHNGIKAHGACRITVRRCHVTDVLYGFMAEVDPKKKMGQFFICDCLFEGMMPWPTTKEEYSKLPEARAVWLGGSGSVVCYNRFHHFKDATDTADSDRCDSNDFHNNEISECFDDGTELDGSERNTRCFLNRYTNIFQGISFQPVYGGPVYAFRNALYNCQAEPFKLHNCPSGAVMIHNTIVRNGGPAFLSTSDSPRNCYSRNNLYIGTAGRAMDYSPNMIGCDFDFDGFGGASGDVFLKWNNVKYASLEEVRAKSPVEKHLAVVDPATAFASGIKPPEDNKKIFDPKINDLRLKEGTAAIDSAEVLPGFNDNFAGKAPDLGAYEFGADLPHYGPREK